MPEKQKRTHKRLAVIMTRLIMEDVDGKSNIKYVADINNISLGGVAMETKAQYDIGTIFKVSFVLPNGQEFKNLLGKVMWLSKSPDKNYVGIRFTKYELFDRIKLAGGLLDIINSNYVADKMLILKSIVEYFKKAGVASVLDVRMRSQITDSGLKIDFDRVYKLFLKVEAAGGKNIRINEFSKIVSAFSKPIEVLPLDFDPVVMKTELFKSKEEIELFDGIRNNEVKYFTAIGAQAYEEAFSILLGLCGNVVAVSEKYKSDEEKVSKEENSNRLSLLYYAKVMYSRIADINAIMES